MPLLAELIPSFFGNSYKDLAPPEPLTKESSRTRLPRGDTYRTAWVENL